MVTSSIRKELGSDLPVSGRSHFEGLMASGSILVSKLVPTSVVLEPIQQFMRQHQVIQRNNNRDVHIRTIRRKDEPVDIHSTMPVVLKMGHISRSCREETPTRTCIEVLSATRHRFLPVGPLSRI